MVCIHLRDLPAEGAAFEGNLPESLIESGPDDPTVCAGPIRYRIHAAVASDTFLADGTLDAPLRLRCRRCDRSFEGRLENLPYHMDQTLDPGVESVDLTDDMRETIMLALPSYPVCRPDCKGLCPQCGADLNTSACHCRPPVDDRWAVLGGLE